MIEVDRPEFVKGELAIAFLKGTPVDVECIGLYRKRGIESWVWVLENLWLFWSRFFLLFLFFGFLSFVIRVCICRNTGLHLESFKIG